MSFVDKLRMQGIFPNSKLQLGWQGQVPVYGGADPLEDIVSRVHAYQPPVMPQPTNRISQVANGLSQQPKESALRFGGVTGQSSNPGGDILGRAKENAENLWESYKKPAVQAGEILAKAGVPLNEQSLPGHTGTNIDKELDREQKRANIDATSRRISDAEARTRIADAKVRNPNLKFIPVKGGNIMAFNPKTGESEDTGISTNTLSDSERLRITQENAMDKQNDAQQFQTEKPQMPSQMKHQLDVRIQEALNRNPQWQDYIDMETGMIAPVGSGKSYFGSNPGLTEQTRQEILRAVYGPQAPVTPTTPNPTAPVTPPVQNQGTPPVSPNPAYKYVPKPGGGWTAVPVSGGQ